MPRSVEVVVDDLERTREDLTTVRALVWVETESQKGILIGAHGHMVKAVGAAARISDVNRHMLPSPTHVDTTHARPAR